MPLRLLLIEEREPLGEALEAVLGREGCDVVGTAGTASEGRALLERLESGTPDARPRPALSQREREIVDLLAQGLTGEQIADRLVLSAETVKTHIRNAMAKLEAHTRVHAIAIALREGFISPPGES